MMWNVIIPSLAIIAASNSLAFADYSFTDPRDNKTYKTVKIGEQVWMARNLNYEAKGSVCDDEHCEIYGRLYNWYAAMKACPKGWHLPSKKEWEILTAAVGGAKTEGKHLKAKVSWRELYFKEGASYGEDFGYYGWWWTANAYVRGMFVKSESAHWTADGDKSRLYSVRCLKD